MSVIEQVKSAVASADNPQQLIAQLRQVLAQLSSQSAHPVDQVIWVDAARVSPNDYNPNAVAPVEMGLLRTSILADGYTQPIVTVYDADADRYVIVDGFHRYFVGSNDAEVNKRTNGKLPIVVIQKPINDRMASTVRHNRARGVHSINGMANLVFRMLENGWQDAAICNELGMEPEELLRIKHITGFSKLFANTEYQKAWHTKQQILLAKQHGKDLV